MRAQDPHPSTERPPAPLPIHNSSAVEQSPAPPSALSPSVLSPSALLGLQRTAGNAAVVQLLRRAGHLGTQAQQEHQHGDGCGHRQTGEAPVQRSAVHEVLNSGGRPLDEVTRTDMEGRLGADFSDVRIHDGITAQRSAAEIGARAYTSGNHVVIGAGGADKHTLAHELTHVIQQRQGPVAGTDNGAGLRVSDPGDRYERAAEENANRAMATSPGIAQSLQRHADPAPAQAPAPSVQRAYNYENPEDPQNLLTVEHWEREAGVTGTKGRKAEVLTKAQNRVDSSGTSGGGKGSSSKGSSSKAKNKASGSKASSSKGSSSSSQPEEQERTIGTIITDIGPGLLAELATKPASAEQLKLYRAMSPLEASSILSYWGTKRQGDTHEFVKSRSGSASDFRKRGHVGMTIGKHLGDIGQAEEYHGRQAAGYEVLLEFELKPGAHEELFKPKHMALGPSYKTELIREAHARSAGDGETPEEFKEATVNEGLRQGYIGVKAEDTEPFSISLAQGGTPAARQVGASQLLFELLIQRITVKGIKGEGIPDHRDVAVGHAVDAYREQSDE
ncbi:DUF4157 domain-containing protein [Kitasatospora viridis]|uniref:Uncharacterized protein DUF4157 n=1 Tax=Kitasatospora viridis TaxID=281105 RepID=A0A561UIY1_9ACTN|nr:DUF4157 domain-containing protein [Kitasatospora viridis]TWF99299.1 uncharacterized protein DUF4157 [Kitasatospora viridis]